MTVELERELQQRVWPQRARLSLADMAQYWRDQNPFVTDGRVVVRRLGLFGDVDEAIPDGESAIAALGTSPHGTVYGTTFGPRAHLFYYDTRPTGDSVADTGVLEGVFQTAPTLAFLGGEWLVGAVLRYDASALDGGYLFRRDSYGDAMHPYRIPSRPATRLATPLPGEGIAAIAADASGEAVIGFGADTATLFRYAPPITPPDGSNRARRFLPQPEVTPRPEKLEILGRIEAQGPIAQCLVSDGGGGLWTAAGGRLVRIDAATGEVELTSLIVPGAERIDRMVADPETRRLYLGVSPGGALAVADLATRTVESLGPATESPGPVRALTVGHDGRVYGTAGPRGALSLFFEYTPGGALRQLGALRASQQRVWTGYEYDAACTGPNGEIVLGESERISHLFVYFPPVKGRGNRE